MKNIVKNMMEGQDDSDPLKRVVFDIQTMDPSRIRNSVLISQIPADFNMQTIGKFLLFHFLTS